MAKYDAVYHLGTTGKAVKAKYYATLQKLRKAPAEGKIGPDEWNDIFVSAGYYVYGWEDVATAFSAYVNDGDSVRPAGPLPGSPVPARTTATRSTWAPSAPTCSGRTNWNKWQRDNWRLYAKYPFITWNNAWFNAPCVFWKGDVGRPVNGQRQQGSADPADQRDQRRGHAVPGKP